MKGVLNAAVAIALVVLCSLGVAQGASIFYVPITGDADCGISSNNVYTHTLDFGRGTPGATINGVAFDAYNLAADGSLNFNRTVSSGAENDHQGNGNHNVSNNLVNLMTDMYFNGSAAAGGTTTWTLSGLTAGVSYDARIYTRMWAASTSRLATLVFDPDGAGSASDSTAQISQDDATQTPPGLSATNDAYYISYRFTAVAGEDLVISATQPVATYSWHLYGLSCQETPISYVPITGDADSGISTNKAYTHKLDFGTGSPGAIINGVAFDAYNAASNGTSGFTYAVSSGAPLAHGGNANHNVSGDLIHLMKDMYINDGNAAGGTATWTLSGLTAGRVYDARIYTRQWGVSANRLATLVFDPDGAGPLSEATGQISQDDATQHPPSLAAANDAYYINYRFTAVSGEDLVITANQVNGNNSWHLYGLSCEDIYPDTWDGGGADDNLQTDLNWLDDTKPLPNDVLRFSGTTRTSPSNNFTAATQFGGIAFLNTTAGQRFSLGGNSITLGGDITNNAASAAIDDTISLDLLLSGAQRTIALAENHNLMISGVISNAVGSGGTHLEKSGTGILTFAGDSPNTYTGTTTITAGTLILQKTNGVDAIAGNITVGDGVGADILRLGADNQIADTSAITIDGPSFGNSGKFELNGFNETVGRIVDNGAFAAVIQSEELGSGKNSTLTVDSSSDYEFGGIIRNNVSGAGSLKLVKVGAGTLTLSGAFNSYSGGTSIGRQPDATQGGMMTMLHSAALGAGGVNFEQGGTLAFGTNGLSVANSIQWYNWGGGTRRLLLDLPGSNSGALTGTFTMRNSSQQCDIDVGADDTLTLSGNLTNWGSINESWDKEGVGTLVLTGTTEHWGWIDINAGTLQFNGDLTAGRAVVRVHNGGTLSGTGSIGTLVTVNSGGRLSPGADTGTLTLSGGLTLNDGVELDIAVDTTGTNDDLISVTGGTFTGSGAGGVTVNVTLTSAETGTYTLMDWTGASESGVETNDFVLNLEGFGEFALDVSGKKLLLNVIGPEGMLYILR